MITCILLGAAALIVAVLWFRSGKAVRGIPRHPACPCPACARLRRRDEDDLMAVADAVREPQPPPWRAGGAFRKARVVPPEDRGDSAEFMDWLTSLREEPPTKKERR
jgi:hypothetical protein